MKKRTVKNAFRFVNFCEALGTTAAAAVAIGPTIPATRESSGKLDSLWNRPALSRKARAFRLAAIAAVALPLAYMTLTNPQYQGMGIGRGEVQVLLSTPKD